MKKVQIYCEKEQSNETELISWKETQQKKLDVYREIEDKVDWNCRYFDFEDFNGQKCKCLVLGMFR